MLVDIGAQVGSMPELRRTLLRLVQQVRNGTRWQSLSFGTFSQVAPSTSTIEVAGDPADIASPGIPLRFRQNDTDYYAVISAVADRLITIAGAPLDVAAPIQNVLIGQPEGVVRLSFYIPGAYGGSVRDILAAVANQYARWEHAPAYIVSFGTRHKTAAGTTQPKVNLKIDGQLISTADSNNGVQVGTSWVNNSAVAVNLTYYRIDRGDDIEVRVTAAESGSAASDLSVSATLILE